MLRRIVVVGASLAGLRAVEALRARGFDGELTLVGDEPYPPYDRPPLSKQVLQGAWPPERTFFRAKDGYEGLALDLRLGRRAVALDAAGRRVLLDAGAPAAYDRLIVATGARVRTVPGTPALDGIHVLRTLDDAIALRRDLEAARRVAVVGAGFIGLEVAASCRALGLDVTVVESRPLPLATVCGADIGSALAAMHRDHGVDLRCGVTVEAITGDSRVTGLQLSDGSRVDADVAVVGVGVIPNTGWLKNSPLTLHDGIVCDAYGQAAPGIYAAGDVARMHNDWLGDASRVEHWTNAVEQAAHVAEQVLAGSGGARFSSVPYFWSDQYDRKVQFVGRASPHDEMIVVEGSPAERQFTALYRRGDRLCACLAINHPRSTITYRRLLARRATWSEAITAR